MAKTVINCEKGRRKHYQKIASSRYFKGDKDLTLALLFAISAAVGFSINKRCKLKNKEWVSRVEYVEKDKNMKRFFQSLAVASEDNLEVLLDEDMAYEIAEEYANGGIIPFYNYFLGNDGEGDLDKQMESQINSIAKKIGLNE
jgi:hypothetical protein